jgi:hypothetical protein
MTCQARVLDKEMNFPGTDVTYHTTKECGEVAQHKYSVDDGDAFMGLCGDGLRRCLTKKSANSTWYGFFDCAYPEQAKVRGSPWYFWQLSLAQEQEKAQAGVEDPPAQLAMEEAELVGAPKEYIQPSFEEEEEKERPLPKAEDPSEKEVVEATIAQLKATVKASPNMPVKEQAKILKQIMDLRFKLKEMKKNK